MVDGTTRAVVVDIDSGALVQPDGTSTEGTFRDGGDLIAVAPDGRTVAVGVVDNVRLFDLPSGNLRLNMSR